MDKEESQGEGRGQVECRAGIRDNSTLSQRTFILVFLFFGVFLLIWMCFSTKWVIAPCGDFQLWCHGCSLFCTSLSLTSRTRTIWKEDWSSSLEEISFPAHEASTFVKELMQPLGTWKPHSRDNRKLSSLRARDVASRVLLLGPGT